ncbi:hypothetical protein C2S51_007220 [Perilla frutescens var. frutescens]|nr:hypothetical protein C2S51_007220 [Perilla frutescens var. frutescens]
MKDIVEACKSADLPEATTQKWNLMKFALIGQSVFKIMWIDKIIWFDEVGMLKLLMFVIDIQDTA